MIVALFALLLVASCVAAAEEKRDVVPAQKGLPNNPVENHAWRNADKSYVQLDAGLNARLGERAFTIEAWVYNESPTSDKAQPIVAHAPIDCPDIFHVDYLLQTNANNGRVAFLMGAGADTYGFLLQGKPLEFNKWTHIAVTVAAGAGGDPTSARLYMNGELVAQGAWQGGASTRQVTEQPITLGYVKIAGAEQNWVGELDEVRFWDSVRTQAAIVRDHRDPFLFSDPVEIPLNLVAYYSFDAGPETAVWDNSRAPYYDGLPINGQTRVVAADVVDVPLSPLFAPFAGPIAYGLEFTGAHGQQNAIELPQELSRRLPRGFTFEAWVYLEAPTLVDQQYKTIVSRFASDAAKAQPGSFAAGSNPEADFVLQVDPRNGRLVFFMGGGRGDCERTSLGYGVALFSSGAQNLKPFEWSHVAVSVFATQNQQDPFSAKMYVNGKEVVQAAELPGNAWRGECKRNYLRFEPIHIGFYSNGIDQFWNGRIDEIRFWSEPRDDAAIAGDYMRPLTGNEPNLLAYYQLNEGQGTVVRDATKNAQNGQATRAAWVLSQASTEVIDGVSGFPVHLTLQARSPFPAFPNNDSFTYVVTELPANGGIFTTGTPIALIEQADVDNGKVVGETLTYVSNIGFTGFDTFGYAAISARTGLKSETHYVVVKVADYQAPTGGKCPGGRVDVCGVCNGDGLSCVGGCDGKGGQVDECGVCAGGGASCTCVFYKTFHTDELDCVLFENQVNRTLARVENSIVTLHRTLNALETFDQSSWRDNFFDLGVPLEHLCAFLNSACLKTWDDALKGFESEIAGSLAACEKN